MQIESVQLAVAFIEKNYSEKLKLETIAKSSFFSPFHFHRIFQAVTGYTPREYQEKIRLERAAHLLHVSEIPIGDISFEVGYENPETFIRRFKSSFGLSPDKFRKKKNISKLLEAKKTDSKRMAIAQEKLSSPQVVRIEKSIPIISMRHTSSVDKIGKTWKEFVKLINKKRKISKEDNFYGIILNNPDITDDESFLLDACYEFPIDSRDLFQSFINKYIEAGNYLKFRYSSEFKYLDVVYPLIYDGILKADRYRLVDGMIFEKYIQSPIFYREKDCITDIFIPIENL
ncbi:AraC family transcriptional regulator [Leptospira sp. GIMC2001]|uniref:AraC family transcriptional regulator n=1 Tax=Leptospira sp. GIMC2001 TaxID=1513297 RepID=UPI00234B9129|nr:AraC family transcriptional regulator [Leptospira sp. GIMC2001]WCL47603.1 AraC family transcriptional regulator [Leptospira sp. GIMC2001]